jgi:hypothetical protein
MNSQAKRVEVSGDVGSIGVPFDYAQGRLFDSGWRKVRADLRSG